MRTLCRPELPLQLLVELLVQCRNKLHVQLGFARLSELLGVLLDGLLGVLPGKSK